MSLSGQTAFITGGGRGIGRAIAERLAHDGAHVILAGRTQAELDDTARLLGGEVLIMDVAERRAITNALARLAGRGQAIDILINNAGAAESAPLERTDDALWDRMLAVNTTSTFTLCRALIPLMVARGFGRVVNVASNAGLTGYAYSAAYCAAKHAVVGLTRALALEVARTPVTVNAVCPGFVATRLVEEAVTRIVDKTGRSSAEARRSIEALSPQRRLVEPHEVAHVVSMLCARAASAVNGQAIPIDGGQVMP